MVEYIDAIDVTRVRFPADADARSESGSSHAVIRSQGLPLALRFPSGACIPTPSLHPHFQKLQVTATHPALELRLGGGGEGDGGE